MVFTMIPMAGGGVFAETGSTANKVDADTVGIYLRTLDKDSSQNASKFIRVPDDQQAALGIEYYYEKSDEGYWVDFGSFRSVKAKEYRDVYGTNTTGRNDHTVQAVVDEAKSSVIDKKDGITFDRLDAVTWDTMSKSNKPSDGTIWHLNGEIPLCKVKFDLNYEDAGSSDRLIRYAVKGTDVNSGLPSAPSREGYIFDGWYTAENGGNAITAIPVLTDDKTYYAHWTNVNNISVKINNIEMAKTADTTYYKNNGTALGGTENDYNAKYEPTTKTLTLKDLNLEGNIETNCDLNIVLEGNNTINSSSDNAIKVDGDLKISGNGSLAASNGTSSQTTVYAKKAMTIKDGAKVNVTKAGGEAQAIHASNITISGTNTAVTATNNGIASSAGYASYALKASSVTVSGGASLTAIQGGSANVPAVYGTVNISEGSTVNAGSSAQGASTLDSSTTKLENPEFQYLMINTAGVEYTITFDANGGYFNDIETKQKTLTLKSGQVITAPDNPSKTSNMKYTYIFSGWYTDKEAGKQVTDFGKASANVTYYAHWIETPRAYQITYDTDGGKINEEYATTYNCNTEYINFPTKVTRAGYNFKGWSLTKGSGTSLEKWPVTEENLGHLTFYALWTPIDAVQPKVSINPTAAAINCGDTADITVTAEADKGTQYELTYQWCESTDRSNENGTLIDGATGNTYTVPADKEAGTYYYFCEVKATRTDNSEFVSVKSDVATVTVTKKSSGSHYKPVQKPVIEAGDGSKTELGSDGTKVTITVEEGYELVDVLVNGISKGKVTELTGLKTGDKVEIKTEKIPEKLEPQAVKNIVKELKLVARSERLSNGNVRIRVTKITDINDNPVDLDELERNGYTVKFKYYRSVKKSAGYDTRLEKEADINSYINNFGDKGTKYYYKVKVMVYDADGNLVAQSNLNQCKYAMRTWIK